MRETDRVCERTDQLSDWYSEGGVRILDFSLSLDFILIFFNGKIYF